MSHIQAAGNNSDHFLPVRVIRTLLDIGVGTTVVRRVRLGVPTRVSGDRYGQKRCGRVEAGGVIRASISSVPDQHIGDGQLSVRTTFELVEQEPRNPASDLARYGFGRFADLEFLAGLPDRLSHDFVADDRRRIVGLGTTNRRASLEGYGLLRDLGGPVKVEVQEILGTRGKRLVALRVRHTFTDRGAEMESIWVIQYDRPVWLTERMVQFDSEDVGPALAELDRLHNEIEANDTPPAST